MTNKHTPGPWKLSGANTVHGPDCIVAFVGTADEEVRRMSGERQNADARLIAAAPELLAALTTMMWCIDAGYTSIQDGEVRDAQTQLAVEAIRAAIAKAKGKP